MGSRQSSPSMMLISLGYGSTIFTNAPSITCKNTSASVGVLRAAAFANSSASMFLFLLLYSIVKPMK
jgi:hypothetical protein